MRESDRFRRCALNMTSKSPMKTFLFDRSPSVHNCNVPAKLPLYDFRMSVRILLSTRHTIDMRIRFHPITRGNRYSRDLFSCTNLVSLSKDSLHRSQFSYYSRGNRLTYLVCNYIIHISALERAKTFHILGKSLSWTHLQSASLATSPASDFHHPPSQRKNARKDETCRILVLRLRVHGTSGRWHPPKQSTLIAFGGCSDLN